jgi:hypothetical protein
MHIFVPIYATVPKTSNHVFGKQETPFRAHPHVQKPPKTVPKPRKAFFPKQETPFRGPRFSAISAFGHRPATNGV